MQRLIAAGAQLVDVLPEREWKESHIAGAIHVPLKKLPELAPERLDTGRPVIVYCYDSLCDLSPRAAARLRTLGFPDVYDYAASKMDWIGEGLPFEGSLAATARLSTLMEVDVPTCEPGDTVSDVRRRLGRWEFAVVVVGPERVVVGLARADAFDDDDGRPVATVMLEAPVTHRPHITADDMAKQLEDHPMPWVLVTTLTGRFLGAARSDTVIAAR